LPSLLLLLLPLPLKPPALRGDAVAVAVVVAVVLVVVLAVVLVVALAVAGCHGCPVSRA
jgi:hypothetical protein